MNYYYTILEFLSLLNALSVFCRALKRVTKSLYPLKPYRTNITADISKKPLRITRSIFSQSPRHMRTFKFSLPVGIDENIINSTAYVYYRYHQGGSIDHRSTSDITVDKNPRLDLFICRGYDWGDTRMSVHGVV